MRRARGNRRTARGGAARAKGRSSASKERSLLQRMQRGAVSRSNPSQRMIKQNVLRHTVHHGCIPGLCWTATQRSASPAATSPSDAATCDTVCCKHGVEVRMMSPSTRCIELQRDALRCNMLSEYGRCFPARGWAGLGRAPASQAS
jgi:hypothetical protein